jgi:glycosyltransferase involved in cell wall biosynthesis
MVQISIIIVSYNTEKLLFNCIKSIYQYAHDLEIEIIVVDNASFDNSVELIRESFPKVILIRIQENSPRENVLDYKAFQKISSLMPYLMHKPINNLVTPFA